MSHTRVVFWSRSDPTSVTLLRELDPLCEVDWLAVAIPIDTTNQAPQIRPLLFCMGLRDVDWNGLLGTGELSSGPSP